MALSLLVLDNPQGSDLLPELGVPLEGSDEVWGFPEQTEERSGTARPIDQNVGNRRTTVQRHVACKVIPSRA